MQHNISIEPYRHDLEVIRNTVLQIKKDFSTFNFEINFSGNESTAYPELKTQLVSIFKDLLRNHSEKVFALLYRIDVPESKLKTVPPSVLFEVYIAELVLERELLKVVMRKLLSKQENTDDVDKTDFHI